MVVVLGVVVVLVLLERAVSLTDMSKEFTTGKKTFFQDCSLHFLLQLTCFEVNK